MEGTKVRMANPGPLGLLGFGMTTVLLNVHNAGFIDLSVMIVAMGLALGGFAQIIAGIFELRQGNTFSGTAFVAYGSFWWSLIFIWLNPGDRVYEADEMSMGFYLLLWGVFSVFMFICTLRQNRAIQVVFLTLVILFFGLAISSFTGIEIIHTITGIVGIVCGASAIYTSMALLLKEEYGREILKICECKGKDIEQE
jgi:succinate-acetate transporter protein